MATNTPSRVGGGGGTGALRNMDVSQEPPGMDSRRPPYPRRRRPSSGQPMVTGCSPECMKPGTARHHEIESNRNEKTRFRGFDHLLSHGAQERTRTSTKLPPLAPEASASTNSATWATQEENFAGEPRMCQQDVEENFPRDPCRRNEKTRLRGFDHLPSRGAQKRTRTSTKLPPLAPEASASTNSAIWATQGANYAEAAGGCQCMRGRRLAYSAHTDALEFPWHCRSCTPTRCHPVARRY